VLSKRQAETVQSDYRPLIIDP